MNQRPELFGMDLFGIVTPNRGFMRQPLMTARFGLARGCNPWASVVFFGAYLCSDQLHASQDWTSESNQMVGDKGFEPLTFCSQSRRSSQTELISVVKLKSIMPFVTKAS